MKQTEVIGKMTEKDLERYIDAKGIEALAAEFTLVARHLITLARRMGDIVQDSPEVCLIGGIHAEVNIYGAGKRIFKGVIGRVEKARKEPEPDMRDKVYLDPDLCFKYKGYDCELCSCNSITTKSQMIGLTEENFRERFPHGVFSDKYVCFIYGHKDEDGITKEECADPDCWCPKQYLVPDCWLFGADADLVPGFAVNDYILDEIDSFLKEHNYDI